MRQLNKGDVIVRVLNSGKIVSTHAIEHVTKTQATFELGGFIENYPKTIKLKRDIVDSDNGYIHEIGADKFSSCYYKLPHGDDIEKGQYNQSLNYLYNVKWENVDKEKVKQIYNLLTK